MSFNENTRVKIPAILHLCRLGYDYLSLSKSTHDENTNIFTDLFSENIGRINPDLEESAIKRLLEDVSLALDNEDLGEAFYRLPTGRMRVMNLEDDKLEDVEVVVGVGVLAEFGQVGYAGISADELYTDVVLDNRDFDAESIIWKALPTLLPHNSNILPMYKYLSQFTGELPERVQEAIKDKTDVDSLLSNTIKKNRERHPCRQGTITSLCDKLSDAKCLQALPHLKAENIDVEELHTFLAGILTANPSALSTGEQGFKTDLKRAIRIYDWLKYHS